MTQAADPARFQLTVHYDGSAFHGWQFQPDRRTVQGDLQAALSKLANQPTPVIGSGRTDTGVHATGQVAAVDMPAHWAAPKLRRSLNSVLHHDIWVESAVRVHREFHPRYDATARTYEYRIGTDPGSASPFHRRHCWALGHELDGKLLAECADVVVGDHSFKAFAKAGQPERGERCVVSRAAWSDWSLGVMLTITADRYLHHMVRYLVGTMVDIGRGRRAVEDFRSLLGNQPGLTTSPPAPPEGLFLARVEYPHSASFERKPPNRSTAAV